MRKLLTYPNCSKGGVSSVIRGRAAAEPETIFDVIFVNDRGGSRAFDDLTNVNVRIIRQDRLISFLKSLTKALDYDAIHVLSQPQVANELSVEEDAAVSYEFHSSNMAIVEAEIDKLQLNQLAEIAVPSKQMESWIRERVPKRFRPRVNVTPNLVDKVSFRPDGPSNYFDSDRDFPNTATPVVWVGRFDRDKGFHYAIRALAQLPDHYFGVFIVSLENDPARVAGFFNECDAMGVRDRIHLLMDISPEEMSTIYRSAKARNGVFMSTSLMESFGYAIAESMSCGLPCVAFNLPILELHEGPLTAVPIGDVAELSRAIQSVTSLDKASKV